MPKEMWEDWKSVGVQSRSQRTPRLVIIKKGAVAAKFVLEGECRADERWTVFSGVMNQMCTDFEPTFFDALLKYV